MATYSGQCYYSPLSTYALEKSLNQSTESMNRAATADLKSEWSKASSFIKTWDSHESAIKLQPSLHNAHFDWWAAARGGKKMLSK